jgi:peptide/nickel transport system substrate-binding protein
MVTCPPPSLDPISCDKAMPAMGILRFNQLYPPFDNAAARRALLSAIDQNEGMMVLAGEDPADHHEGVGIFATGTPLANDAGIEVMTRPRDYPAAKKALAEAGYNDQKIVVISPTEVSGIPELSKVGTEQLRRAGVNIDFHEIWISARLSGGVLTRPRPTKADGTCFSH